MFGETTLENLVVTLLRMDLDQTENAQIKELINCSESVSYTDDEIESSIFLMIKKMKNNKSTTEPKSEKQEVEFEEPEVKSGEPKVESEEPEVESEDTEVESEEPEVESEKPEVEQENLVKIKLYHGTGNWHLERKYEGRLGRLHTTIDTSKTVDEVIAKAAWPGVVSDDKVNFYVCSL